MSYNVSIGRMRREAANIRVSSPFDKPLDIEEVVPAVQGQFAVQDRTELMALIGALKEAERTLPGETP